jgi:signal transduction histidine kinase
MEKMKYNISSRATILLGRESVSKVESALIELIKNTYDADATICYILFDVENDNILLIDNGSGMTKKIIEDNWMMIGTDNKKKEYISKKKRIKSGEKGIGRFALDRLGGVCELFTKSQEEHETIRWKTNWNSFEEEGNLLEDIEAEFEYVNLSLYELIPENAKSEIMKVESRIDEKTSRIDEKTSRIDKKTDFSTGTIIKISNLRDEWTNNQIEKIKKSMEFLIPPKEQDEFYICLQKSIDSGYELIENNFSDEFDYKVKSVFDGENFVIYLYRNEFDVDKIPESVFRGERFMRYPYRKEDFKEKCLEFKYSISQLFNTNDPKYVERIKNIGGFTFEYVFMKLQNQKKEVFFYKEIGKTRNEWLEEHGGIKIYRDNFWVRPYGENGSDSFDWLGLEARNNANPVAVSSKTEAWTVRNAQGQGTVFISRVNNASILDKSSREGIIENESFKLLKETLIRIISVLEKDRSYIARSFKIYDDKVNHKEKTKQEGSQIAKSVLSGKKDKNHKAQKEKIESLAKTVQYFEEEREELITELKLLRALATNGLITTSIVHDLKSINALLVNRVEPMRMAIENNNQMLIDRNLNDLYKNDEFLKSWITVVTNQSKKDKRKRLKKNIYDTIEKIVNVLQPILAQKKVHVELIKDERNAERKIFESDFESIIYNLIINSIEAFSKSSTENRKIRIELKTNENLIVNYLDNGDGLDDIFKDPYEIFTLGSTSKYDQFGNVIGTGLGMYIIASTVREYNGDYKLTQTQNGFGLEIRIPL